MKKSNCSLFGIIIMLITIQFISAQDEESSQVDVVGTGSFGAATINGKIYNQISFRPELRYKKLGIGLDINFYIDENGEVYDGNWLVDDSRSTFQTIMDKIYYIRWGSRYDNFYFRVGALESVTLGYGSLVDRYSNAMEYPQIKKLGLDLIYGTDKLKLEFVNSNFSTSPALIGFSAKYNMSPRTNIFISLAHDPNQLTRLDEIYVSRDQSSWVSACEETLAKLENSTEDYSQQCGGYYSALESGPDYDDAIDEISGISIGADYVLSESMSFYTEWSHLLGKIEGRGENGEVVEDESLGQGIVLPGFIYRFKNGLFQVEYRQALTQNFVFNYWDRSYDIERAIQDPSASDGYRTKKEKLYNYGRMGGLYAFISYDILKIMNFGFGYQNMKGDIWKPELVEVEGELVPDSELGSYVEDSNRSFRASLNLNPNLIPKVNKVEYFYQRNNDLSLDITSLFKENELGNFGYESIHAVHGYDIGIEAAANITIIYQSRTTYRFMEDGLTLEPIRIMQLDTQFYF
jgi:hypothetical protein